MINYRSITDMPSIRRYLAGVSPVAFDFETAPDNEYRKEPKAALDAHKAHITGVSFSVTEGDAIYVPLAHRVGVNCEDPDALWAFLKESIFESHDVICIAHNLSFEAMFLYKQGIVVQEPCYDTIAAAQLTMKSKWEFRGLHDSGLKLLATSLFGADMPSFSSVTDGRHFDEMNPQEYETVRYACADSDYTLCLYYKFNNWFDRFLPAHRIITEQLESPTAVMVGCMKYNGIPVDRKAMLEKQTEAVAKVDALKAEINELTGGVNIGANASTSAFKQYLYKDLGLPVLKKTEKNQEAADDAAMQLLEEYCAQHRPELVRLFQAVQEYRKWGKLKSTYIDGYLDHVNSATGRIHPDLMPLGTDTGRWAARNPNMQNAPRKTNDPIGIRNFIVAPPGQIIMSLDFSQIELRVGAFYCRDPKMLETYRSGGDIHAQTTSVVFGVPFEVAVDKNAPNYKEHRTIAKNCNFGVFYGLFPRGLQKTLRFKAGLDTSFERCKEIIDNLKSGYSGLTTWQEETKARAAKTCYAETWMGRRRYLPHMLSSDWGKHSFAERCALNTPVQGTAADILKAACARIVAGFPERPWLKPILQIHDELVFLLPEERLLEAQQFVKKCMEQQPYPDFDVPIVAEASAGHSFGAMKEWEELGFDSSERSGGRSS
ncbi:DNA-directed DNA polymerase [Pseudoramibacter alactolyticus ATCC 23263]|uniref:DNA polymerase I n=1 Tax=Pseudoramibacter alactolyticus ATCC 23263 TaxID=887929 RepID=E6MKA8_9FIRM|nr:bifunctional 3'-5' exonuclease/DNA polymerase [Pseudoramibacter alactolyticus]EFV00627.1 DNA-directed DNA polymerase [Pseudoramibacter alactolyticus ATCC 23263]